MAVRTRLMMFALAASMTVGVGDHKAHARKGGPPNRPLPPETRQSRRATETRPHQTLEATFSPSRRHAVQVRQGVVLVNGKRVHPAGQTVWLVTHPVWRKDGSAVAWIERCAGVTRLVVVPDVGTPVPLTWDLPANAGDENVIWAGTQRIHVGSTPLAPRAVATWSDGV